MTSRSFDEISSDYAFFTAHATESAADVKAIQSILKGRGRQPGAMRILDVGSGDGTFLSKLLRVFGESNECDMAIGLVEPGPVALERAFSAMVNAGYGDVSRFRSLDKVGNRGAWDIVLANHSLYYVGDLRATLKSLRSLLASEGVLICSMAGLDNVLIDLWLEGFSLIDRDMPFFIADDLRRILRKSGQFEEFKVEYSIAFPDSIANRLKIVRFLFADLLPVEIWPKLLAYFDNYVRDGEVRINTKHDLYVIT